MNAFKVADLKSGSFFTEDVTIDKTFLLLTNLIPVSDDLIAALNDWSFTEVYSEGSVSLKEATPASDIPEAGLIEITDEFDEEKNGIQKPDSAALKQSIENVEQKEIQDTEASRITTVLNVYNEYLNYIYAVYTRYATHKELDYNDISATVKELCFFIKDNKNYILRLNPTQDAQSKMFLINHSLRSTIIAITIGFQLRFPLSKLVELGVACLLHEIGMLQLPPQYYMSDKMLSGFEKKAILTHPLYSYNILKKASFPLSICLGVLDHHEREDGSGYPRHLPGTEMSIYAKIIAVACSYEAITAPRHFKDAQSSYEAMVEILKNSRKTYNESIIKALLCSLSLFPIGSYVYLSDGRIGQVIDANPADPKNPIVQVLNDPTTLENKEEMITTSETGIHVIRPLNKEETEEVRNSAAEIKEMRANQKQ
ncbi:MAG: HD domain-containing protein [Treponemataceae bacterium]|nr:HD domain-containing protein [Treponemataceae bacterium]